MKKSLGLIILWIALGMLLNMVFYGFSGTPAEMFFSKPGRNLFILSPYIYSILILLCINVIMSSSLAIVNGFTGQFTMGHAGFMAIGAYASAATIFYGFPHAAPLLQLIIGVLVGALSASFAGLVIGVPCLRLRGDYLGMTTLGFGEIIRVVLLNVDAVGGARGMTDIPQFMNLGWVFAIMGVSVLVIKRVRDGRFGRAMFAIRENEIAAHMMGISLTNIKVKAFVLSSAFAGIAGACFAHSEGYLSTQTFTFVKSFEIIAMNVIGGLGSLSGAILGGMILSVMPEALRKLQDFTGVDLRMIIYSLMMILIMITKPQGILGQKEWKWLSSK